MLTCDVCMADVVLVVSGKGYCLQHIDEGFLFCSRIIAQLHGWDVGEVEQQMRDYILEPEEDE